MKRRYKNSGIMGIIFFVISYFIIWLGFIPSLIVGGIAYGAGMLLFKEKKIKFDFNYSIDKENISGVLKQGKEITKQIGMISDELEDKDISTNVKDICLKSNKILDVLSEKPEQLNSVHNFLNYYLPVTVKILKQYDVIENQKLTSKDSLNFLKKVQGLIKKINIAFEKQLNNMYESDIISTEADIKVFEAVLKTDGFLDENLDLKGEQADGE
ncbi:MAG: 5-bromo-4-chloroindolyl phosphate hydrolysis family protein [Oscillospiraceae bacterium]|nr:5-bromo-4-chloroindolyl phosphate hydrolysis family protein [Oscillospiraceae bacterium]